MNTDRPPVVSAPFAAAGNASTPISFDIQVEDPDGDATTGLSASGMPPGASLTHGPNGDRFDWVPDPEQAGTFAISFNASSGSTVGSAETEISVSPSAGPRRPRVDPDLLELQPGKRNSERILSRDSNGNAYANLILVGDVTTSSLEGIGVQVGTRLGKAMTAVSPLSALPALFDLEGLESVKAPATCELYLDSSLVSIDAEGIRTIGQVQRPLVGRTGAGVLLGFLDSGIDLGHGDFRKGDSDGPTRLVGYWVRTHYSFPHSPPQGFGFPNMSSFFGSEWTPSEINDGLVDSWGADSLGHGTHLAGIAGGNGQDFVPCLVGQYQGVAPEADLCVVKVTRDNAFVPTQSLTTSIVDGVKYVFMKADELGEPAVVNISLGSHKGPHNGRSFLDWSISKLVKDYGPGKVVVAAAGNDGNTGIHATAHLHPGLPQEIALEVENYAVQPPANAGNEVFLEGWYDNRDAITVAVLTPSDSLIGPVALMGGNGGPKSTPDGRVTICHGYICDPPTWEGGTWSPDEYFYIKIQDTFNVISSGSWKILIGTQSIGGSGVVDLYLPEIDMPTLVHFQIPDLTHTIASPASADSVISVGAYSTRLCWKTTDAQTICKGYASQLGDVLFASSRGPRRGHNS
ncbi:MAG TPA: S8 family serine peptidase, partial [Candidatus Eisenbacteria bacterium]|nr:S8 family serine peptidase [Candidatus Eisenbacteria bacterium]